MKNKKRPAEPPPGPENIIEKGFIPGLAETIITLSILGGFMVFFLWMLIAKLVGG